MSPLWTPQPSAALATDLPLLLAAPEVQALVFRLGHTSRAGRVPVGDDPHRAVVAMCGGAAWAAGALDAAAEAGFVREEGGELVLAWEWPVVGGGSASAPSGAPSGASTPPAALRPRASDERAAERRLRALWSRYSLNTPEARVAWIDSPAGARALGREGRDRAWAVVLAGRVSTDPRGRFGCPVGRTTADNSATDNRDGQPRTTATDNRTDNRPPSPAPPPSEKNEKESQKARAVGSTTARTTDADNQRTDNRTDNRPRLPTAEPPPDAIGARELFMVLRGDGGLRLTLSTGHEAELERVLAGVSPSWTRESARRLASHVKEGHLREAWKPALSHLRGRDGSWTTLLSLHDEAGGCGRCNGEVEGSDDSDPWTLAERKGVVT